MNKKTIERIAVFALAAFLVGYFCYQVAYGMTIGRNGTMNMIQNGNNYGTFKAPPGSTVTNITVKPIIYTHLNGTWFYFNGTSKASGTITFGTDLVSNNKWNERVYGFMAYINRKNFTGTYQTDGYSWLSLCHGNNGYYGPTKCADLDSPLEPAVWTSNQIVLTDRHNDTIYLYRCDLFKFCFN
jgi:hypothetical protein